MDKTDFRGKSNGHATEVNTYEEDLMSAQVEAGIDAQRYRSVIVKSAVELEQAIREKQSTHNVKASIAGMLFAFIATIVAIGLLLLNVDSRIVAFVSFCLWAGIFYYYYSFVTDASYRSSRERRKFFITYGHFLPDGVSFDWKESSGRSSWIIFTLFLLLSIILQIVTGVFLSKMRFENQIDGLIESGNVGEAAIVLAKSGRSGAINQSRELWDQIANRSTIAAGNYHSVAIQSDGSVIAVGDDEDGQCSGTSYWSDIIAVSAGNGFTVGLRSNGTVEATGINGDGRCNVYGWRDIVEIATGIWHTVGLKADGTVVAVGDDEYGQCSGVYGWSDIVAIAACEQHTIGLKADGTVVATGQDDMGQCSEVSGWSGISEIATGAHFTVGLNKQGSLKITGSDYGYARGWSNIDKITAWSGAIVGFANPNTANGAYRDIFSNGQEGYGTAAGSWHNIIDASIGWKHTLGLRADGTVIAAGNNDWGQCNVSGWNDIMLS